MMRDLALLLNKNGEFVDVWTASILGIRWLRKYPGMTFTTSPAFHSLWMDCSTG
jgi:hypothetical protein